MSHVHLPLTPDWLWWSQPWVWVLLLVPALPLLWWLWSRPQRRPVLRFSSLDVVRAARTGWLHRLAWVPRALRLAVLACLLVAAARPQRPNESRRVHVEGIAIQMVLDISSSMLDTDLTPPGTPRGREQTRLDVAKEIFREFVMPGGSLPGRPNDLVGMIRFARYPDSVCPLTLDREVLLDLLDQTRTVVWLDDHGRLRGDRNEDQTAIGDGLALAVERLKDLKRTTGSGAQLVIHSRVVILLTDGENNAGMVTPEQAGELAATYGIKVYTILVGTGRQDPLGRRWPLDDAQLRNIAAVTGGRFFHARDKKALVDIYAEIDRLERTRTEERSFVEWGDLSWPLLMAAFAGLCAQVVIESTLLRRIP